MKRVLFGMRPLPRPAREFAGNEKPGELEERVATLVTRRPASQWVIVDRSDDGTELQVDLFQFRVFQPIHPFGPDAYNESLDGQLEPIFALSSFEKTRSSIPQRLENKKNKNKQRSSLFVADATALLDWGWDDRQTSSINSSRDKTTRESIVKKEEERTKEPTAVEEGEAEEEPENGKETEVDKDEDDAMDEGIAQLMSEGRRLVCTRRLKRKAL